MVFINRIVLSHFSAFAVLRYARINHGKILKARSVGLPRVIPDKKFLMELHQNICRFTSQNIRLDVMVSSKCKQEKWNFVKFHYFEDKLNSKYLYKIKIDDTDMQKTIFDQIYFSCPELCFLQLSTQLPQERLILFGLELCGTYAIEPNSEKGFVDNLEPVTSIDKIDKYIKSLKGLRFGNAKFAQSTLKWIADKSASPAESKLFLMLCGPRKLGFFQVSKLNLNSRILLTEEAQKICNYKSIKPDLSLATNKLAIEYDSKAFHENVEQNQVDKSRLMALSHDGWKVITIVPQTLRNYTTFETIVKDILKHLNQDTRIRSKNFNDKSHAAFIALKNLYIN